MTDTETRVLSVSYGSFSVKLQGFDDPFSIMKRVTEYFREVTKIDPTFGTKPLIEDLSILENLDSNVWGDEINMTAQDNVLTIEPQEGERADPEVDFEEREEAFVAPQFEAPFQKFNVVEEVAAEVEEIEVDLTEEVAEEAPQFFEELMPQETANIDLLQLTEDNAQMPFVKEEAATPSVVIQGAKRQFRIIRNEYAYEEAPELETATTVANEPAMSPNPFRKFPQHSMETPEVVETVEETIENTVTQQVTTQQEVQEEDMSLEEDILRSFRRLSAD